MLSTLARTPALSLGLRALSTSSATANFADLARITSTPAPSAFSVALPPAASDARGYAPGAMALRADPVLDLFTNMLMQHGKKAEAQRHAANILAMLQAATNAPPLPQLHRAIEMASPSIKLLSMRKRAKTVQTPRALTERQRTRTGIKWLLKAAERGRKGGVKRDDRVAREVLAVLDGSSDVFKRVEEVHKIAMLQRWVQAERSEAIKAGWRRKIGERRPLCSMPSSCSRHFGHHEGPLRREGEKTARCRPVFRQQAPLPRLISILYPPPLPLPCRITLTPARTSTRGKRPLR
jgi:small subunit ribosomal protein S7